MSIFSNCDALSVSTEDDEFIMLVSEISNEDRKTILCETRKSHSIDEFEVINFLGEGSYAKVVKARHKETGKIYALKILSKKYIKKVCFLAL